jgi:hypothetical protein
VFPPGTGRRTCEFLRPRLPAELFTEFLKLPLHDLHALVVKFDRPAFRVVLTLVSLNLRPSIRYDAPPLYSILTCQVNYTVIAPGAAKQRFS